MFRTLVLDYQIVLQKVLFSASNADTWVVFFFFNFNLADLMNKNGFLFLCLFVKLNIFPDVCYSFPPRSSVFMTSLSSYFVVLVFSQVPALL